MEYRVKSTALLDIKSNIIIGLYENGELSPSAQKIDEISQGYLSKLIQSGEIKGKLGQVLVLRHVPNYSAERVFVVGAGKKGEINEKQFKQLIQDTINAVKATSAKEVISYLSDIKIKDRDLYWNIRFSVETLETSVYQFEQFKSKKSEQDVALTDVIFSAEGDVAQQAVNHAKAIALGVRAAKDVANCPPNVCNPVYLAEQANALATRSDLIKTTVLGEKTWLT